jgi:hypothetical protein
MRTLVTVTILALAATAALAHRLDEYLQGTIVSVEKNRLQAQMTLTPGVAVYPIVIGQIDTDANSIISEAEQRAYAERVLRDLSLTIDGHRLTPRLVSMEFPAIEEMKEGRGEIRFEFSADLPPSGPNRKLTIENHHQSRIAAYQVNCLVPRDPDIRIVAQNRNYSQSLYELDYVEAGVHPGLLSSAWWSGDRGCLVAVALLLFARFAVLRRDVARTFMSAASRFVSTLFVVVRDREGVSTRRHSTPALKN